MVVVVPSVVVVISYLNDLGATGWGGARAIRLTEQGEVITAKYANPEVGRRNLEVLAAATMEGVCWRILSQHHA